MQISFWMAVGGAGEEASRQKDEGSESADSRAKRVGLDAPVDSIPGPGSDFGVYVYSCDPELPRELPRLHRFANQPDIFQGGDRTLLPTRYAA